MNKISYNLFNSIATASIRIANPSLHNVSKVFYSSFSAPFPPPGTGKKFTYQPGLIYDEFPPPIVSETKTEVTLSHKKIISVVSNRPEILDSLPASVFRDPNLSKAVCSVLLEKSPLSLMDNIKKFNLLDEAFREELAFKLLKTDPDGLTEIIDSLDLSEKARFELALSYIKHSETERVSNLSRFALSDLNYQEVLTLFGMQKKPSSLENYLEIFRFSRTSLAKVIMGYGKLLNLREDSPVSRQQLLQILTQIARYRNHTTTISLFNTFIKNLSNSDYTTVYLSWIAPTGSSGAISSHLILPAVYPCKWLVKSQTSSSSNQELREAFLQNPKAKSALRNQESSSLTRDFLFACLALDADFSLSYEDKLRVLTAVCVPKVFSSYRETSHNLTLLRLLCERNKGGLLLKENLSEDPRAALFKLTESSLIRDSYATIDQIPEVITAYKNTFGKTFTPNALQLYESGLKQLDDPLIHKIHTAFVRSVLFQGNMFKRLRYSLGDNPNLQAIAGKSFKVFHKWKQELIPPLTVEGITVRETDDPLVLFQAPSEAEFTCQSYTFSPNYNKFLTGSFCSDGGIRIIVAENPEKKPIAFRFLRILQDDKENPVLLLEPLYGNKSVKAIDDAIKTLGIQKAESLGCKIFMQKKDSPTPFKGSFTYLGGKYEMTYFDLLTEEIYRSKINFTIPGIVEM